MSTNVTLALFHLLLPTVLQVTIGIMLIEYSLQQHQH